MSEKQNKTFSESAKDAWEKGCEIGRNLVNDRTELRKEIASRIRKCRLDARLTQEEVSEKIEANALTYKGYENCRSDVPTVYLVRIADFYGVSVDYLVGRTDRKEESSSGSLEERIVQLEQMMEALKGQHG
jgi:ribosome-binding protein aMBF1 (putative translation factor)